MEEGVMLVRGHERPVIAHGVEGFETPHASHDDAH
jgi:hypothetical protein